MKKPLLQSKPHHCGIYPEEKYFVYTGNANWGIQNLEYDEYSGDWFAAVYRGSRPEFPNYPMFVIDGTRAPEVLPIKGTDESGKQLFLKQAGLYHSESGIYGYEFKRGTTGLCSLGNEYFYISHEGRTEEKLETSTVCLYRWTGEPPAGFEKV